MADEIEGAGVDGAERQLDQQHDDANNTGVDTGAESDGDSDAEIGAGWDDLPADGGKPAGDGKPAETDEAENIRAEIAKLAGGEGTHTEQPQKPADAGGVRQFTVDDPVKFVTEELFSSKEPIDAKALGFTEDEIPGGKVDLTAFRRDYPELACVVSALMTRLVGKGVLAGKVSDDALAPIRDEIEFIQGHAKVPNPIAERAELEKDPAYKAWLEGLGDDAKKLAASTRKADAAQVVDAYQDHAARKFYADLKAQAPEAFAAAGSPALVAWLKNQAPEVKALAEKTDVKSATLVYRLFKAETGGRTGSRSASAPARPSTSSLRRSVGGGSAPAAKPSGKARGTPQEQLDDGWNSVPG